jgi:ring-1,2-phenylacetyl-CoA epoxidase subunit PaaC
MTQKELLFQYTLRLADDALIMGHRLSEWCSKAPILEEDLALTNMALDYIGRAEALLQYAAELEGKEHTENDLAYKRDERHFYNHLLCEQPNGNFADTMARQLLLSTFEYHLFTALLDSQDVQLSAIAHKAIKEVKYHKQHAHDWCVRLGDGTQESHELMQAAFNQLWMYTGELFEKDQVIDWLSTAGIAVDSSSLEGAWTTDIINTLQEAKMQMPTKCYMQTGSIAGIHSEHLGYILAEMQYLPRAYPSAKW